MNEKFFTVFLPSNTPSSGDLQNTCAHFKVRLAKPIEGHYDVALSEVSYSYSWGNVLTDQTIGFVNKESGKHLPYNSILKQGYYADMNALLTAINMGITASQDAYKEKIAREATAIESLQMEVEIAPFIGVNSDGSLIFRQGLVSFKKQSSLGNHNWSEDIKLEVPKALRILLGIDEQLKVLPYQDWSGFIRSIFLYADLVEHSRVGDSLTQLLKIVEVPSHKDFGKQITIKYTNLNWVKVLHTRLDEIEIWWRTDTGQTLPFMFGRTYLTLAFREHDQFRGLF